MKSLFVSAAMPLAALTVAAVAGVSAPAFATDRDVAFFQSVEGVWSGPGEIVAGKYKGTKFTCKLNGTTPAQKAGMMLDGDCRVGMFTQPMKASIEQKGRNYQGTFLDGAVGKGMDIVSGAVVNGEKVVMALNRNQLNGVMQARVQDKNTMHVTISVRVDDKLVPVIGMSLNRIDDTAVGAIAKN